MLFAEADLKMYEVNLESLLFLLSVKLGLNSESLRQLSNFDRRLFVCLLLICQSHVDFSFLFLEAAKFSNEVNQPFLECVNVSIRSNLLMSFICMINQ